MNPPGASSSEMPGFPFPGRPGGEHDEPLLDMILGRRALPPDAPPEIHDLARMLAALSGPAEPGELDAEPDVRAAFAQLGPLSPPGRSLEPLGVSHLVRRPRGHRRPTQHRRSHRSPGSTRGRVRPRARVATALVATMAGLVIVGAYSGVLPGPVQRLAHATVAAPAPHRSGARASSTLDTRQGTRRPPQTTAPDHLAGSATTSAGGGSPTPHHPSRSSTSPGYHRTTRGCGLDPWWLVPLPTGESGYRGPLSWAQPNHCTGPATTRPSASPSLGSY